MSPEGPAHFLFDRTFRGAIHLIDPGILAKSGNTSILVARDLI